MNMFKIEFNTAIILYFCILFIVMKHVAFLFKNLLFKINMFTIRILFYTAVKVNAATVIDGSMLNEENSTEMREALTKEGMRLKESLFTTSNMIVDDDKPKKSKPKKSSKVVEETNNESEYLFE